MLVSCTLHAHCIRTQKHSPSLVRPPLLPGVAGYAWVAVLHQWLALSFSTTLLAANVLPVAWLAAFTWLQGRSSNTSSSGWGRHAYQEVPLEDPEAEQALQGEGVAYAGSCCSA